MAEFFLVCVWMSFLDIAGQLRYVEVGLLVSCTLLVIKRGLLENHSFTDVFPQDLNFSGISMGFPMVSHCYLITGGYLFKEV